MPSDRPTPRPIPRPVFLLAAALAAPLLPACGADPDERRVVLERTELLLVESPERMRVLEEHPAAPVEPGVVQPQVSTSDAGPLPALRLAPPATVEFDLAGLPEGAVLELAAGLDGTAYEREGEARVRYEVHLDGEPVLEAERLASSEVPRAERTWVRDRIPLTGARRLRLATSLAGESPGASEDPPPAAYGLLEVRVPFPSRRTASSAEAPNVVLVLVDTLRADRLGAYGGQGGLTPELDALAERGTLWEQCYAPAPWTWPSTASLLTGLAPPEHGVDSKGACFLAHGHTSLPELFQASEVRTGAFSTNVLISAERNFDQGFEDFHEDPWATVDTVMPEVEGWLRDAADERFFLYVHLTDPHTPYDPPEDLAAAVGEPPRSWRPGQTWPAVHRRLVGRRHDEGRIRAAAAHDLELYDQEVASVDRSIGALVDLLAELDLDGRTLVCVTSDHGEEFFEHGMYHHTKQLYEEVMHVPLILAGPGVERGRRVSELAELTAVAATLTDLAGLGDEFGRRHSLLAADAAGGPIFVGSEVGWWFDEEADALRMQEEPLYGVVDGALRFHWGRGAGDEPRDLVRLYDLGADPGQRADLAAERPELVRAYREELEAWLGETRARRPSTFGGDADVLDMLRELGYAGLDAPEPAEGD